MTQPNRKNSNPLRAVQIGVANFGRHRRMLMRQSGLFDLRAVYDRNVPAMLEAAAEEGCQVTRNYEELLETPGIEAVVISTGALYHAEQIEMAARRGLHVFVEKPICATPAEVQLLLDLEKETGVVIAVGHTLHEFSPVSRTIRRLIESGELGTVATFQEITAHGGGLQIRPGDWRGDPIRNPGGMLFQCGVHSLHELMFYFGPIREVFASMRYDVHTTRTADVAHCHLQFESGLIGVLSAFHVTPYKHSLHLFGTRANLYREERYFDEGTSLSLQRGRADSGKEALEPVAIEGDPDETANLREFYRAIRNGSHPAALLHDGLRAVQAVFAAEESARLGMPVLLTELPIPADRIIQASNSPSFDR